MTETPWVRIATGDLNDAEWFALSLVANLTEQTPPCRLTRQIQGPWVLVHLGKAKLIELRNFDGDARPFDMEQATTGGWLGVYVQVTAKGRDMLRSRAVAS